MLKGQALYVIGFWFVLQFINSTLSSSQGGGVAYAAHIGGFISGIILILFFNKKKIKNKIKATGGKPQATSGKPTPGRGWEKSFKQNKK